MNTVKPFDHAPKKNQDPSNFDRGLDKGIGFQNLNIFINSYIYVWKYF